MGLFCWQLILQSMEDEMNKKFNLQDRAAGWYAVTVYGTSKRDALNRYRAQWYPERKRLPVGCSIWDA